MPLMALIGVNSRGRASRSWRQVCETIKSRQRVRTVYIIRDGKRLEVRRCSVLLLDAERWQKVDDTLG